MPRLRQTSRQIMTLATNGSQRASLRLLNNVRTHRWFVTIRAQVQVTTLATAILNKGSAGALVQLFVNENGRDRWSIDGRMASFMSNVYAAGALSNTRLTSTAVGTYNIVERIALQAAPWHSIVPSETTFAESVPSAPFTIEAIAQPNGFARMYTGGAGTINSLTVEVEQEYVQEAEAPLPYFIPTVREYVENIVGANGAYPIYIKTPNRLRGMLITQDSDSGECSDIITAIGLRADNGDIIGPTLVTYDNFAEQQEHRYSGPVYLSADATRIRSHVFINFQEAGRLSNVLFPQRDHTNLRLELTTGVSAFTNPKVRITFFELERPEPVGGRVLVNPLMPKELV